MQKSNEMKRNREEREGNEAFDGRIQLINNF